MPRLFAFLAALACSALAVSSACTASPIRSEIPSPHPTTESSRLDRRTLESLVVRPSVASARSLAEPFVD